MSELNASSVHADLLYGLEMKSLEYYFCQSSTKVGIRARVSYYTYQEIQTPSQGQ